MWVRSEQLPVAIIPLRIHLNWTIIMTFCLCCRIIDATAKKPARTNRQRHVNIAATSSSISSQPEAVARVRDRDKSQRLVGVQLAAMVTEATVVAKPMDASNQRVPGRHAATVHVRIPPILATTEATETEEATAATTATITVEILESLTRNASLIPRPVPAWSLLTAAMKQSPTKLILRPCPPPAALHPLYHSPNAL